MAKNKNALKSIEDRVEEIRATRRSVAAPAAGTTAAAGAGITIKYATNHERAAVPMAAIEQDNKERARQILQDAKEAAALLKQYGVKANREYKLPNGKTAVRGWDIVDPGITGPQQPKAQHRPLAPGEMAGPQVTAEDIARIRERLAETAHRLPPPDSPEHRAQIEKARVDAIKAETIYRPGAHGEPDAEAEIAALEKRPGHHSKSAENHRVVTSKLVLGEDGTLYKIQHGTPFVAPEWVPDPNGKRGRSRTSTEPRVTDRDLLRTPRQPGPEQRGRWERLKKSHVPHIGRSHTVDGSLFKLQPDRSTDKPKQIIREMRNPDEIIKAAKTQDSWRDQLARFVDLRIGDTVPGANGATTNPGSGMTMHTETVYDGEIDYGMGLPNPEEEVWDAEIVPEWELPSGIGELPASSSNPQHTEQPPYPNLPPPPIALGPGPTPPQQ